MATEYVRRQIQEAGRGVGSAGLVARRGEHVFPPSGYYPRTWEELIGQEQARAQLKAAIESARYRGKPLDHVLLAAGDPGVGKTSIALLVARDMDVPFVPLSDKVSADQFAKALRLVGPGGIVFYDEIHRVNEQRDHGQFLLTYLHDGLLYVNGQPADVPTDVTLIGATTEAGKLKPALRERFSLQPHLEPYTDEQAAQICRGLADKVIGAEQIAMPVPQSWYQAVATAANHRPRIMAAVLESVRDITFATRAANWSNRDSTYDLTEPLRWNGLRPDGVTNAAADYLVTLYWVLNGRAGKDAITQMLNEPGGVAEVERLLLAKGLIRPNPSGRGRELTDAGTTRVRQILTEEYGLEASA